MIELLIGELYNQGRCDRHARQLHGSVAGNSGDIFFVTCFRQFMIFCAKFYFSAQMATMAIGNTNPVSKSDKLLKSPFFFFFFCYFIENIRLGISCEAFSENYI